MMATESSTNYEIFKSFIAGGVAGAWCVAAGHPFDTVKVRLQTMPTPLPGMRPMYLGAVDCMKQIIIKEGFLALYKVSRKLQI